jgi:hypothetical protein
MTMSKRLGVYSMGLVHNKGELPDFLHAFSLEQQATKQEQAACYPPASVQELGKCMPSVPLRRIPHYARMALLAAHRTLMKAPEDVDLHELSLVIGTAYAGVHMSMDFMDSIVDASPRLSSPTAFSHAVNNMGAGLLSLYLGLHGACHTVTQFNLSFAGALSLAATLVHAQRARYVLVGGVEEYDQRFMQTCPQTATAFPQAEGSVFVLVGKEAASKPSIAVSWQTEGAAAPLKHRSFYGESPLAQGFETALALATVPANQEITLSCCHQHSQRRATIHIKK